MGNVKILVNPCMELNAKSGKNSPNKDKIKIKKDRIAIDYSQYGICVLKPVIDRIVIEYDLQDFNDEEKAKLEPYIRNTLIHNMIHKHGLYKQVDKYWQNKPPFKNYEVKGWLIHQPTGQKIRILACPLKDGKPFIKFDFNPSLLGKEGVKFFKKEIEEEFVFPDTENVFSFDAIWQHNNTIDRLDIAVEILGADISDMKMYAMKAGKVLLSKSQHYSNDTGRLQTYYTVAKKGTSNSTYFYNKKAKLIEDGNQPMFGDILHTRLEHRTKTTLPMKELTKLQNHLKKVDAEVINYDAIADKDFMHELFLRYAITRSPLQKALEKVPDDYKADLASSYDKAMLKIWDPEKIWKHWPDTVKNSGLLN